MSYERAIALMEKSVARPTLFSVRIGGGKVSNKVNDYLDFFCTVTSIPSITANTEGIVGQEYQGIVRETPNAIIFGKPLTLTIIENSDHLTYKALRAWFNQISPNANQVRGPGSTGRSIRMNYYNTFVSNIELTKLEMPDNVNFPYQGENLNNYYKTVFKVNFINAFPISIGEMVLDSSAVNQPVYWDAQFTYESFSIDDNIPDIPILPPPVS